MAKDKTGWPEVFIHKDKGDKDPYYHYVFNGKPGFIKKDEWVAVPPYVYELIVGVNMQTREADARIEKMLKETRVMEG